MTIRVELTEGVVQGTFADQNVYDNDCFCHSLCTCSRQLDFVIRIQSQPVYLKVDSCLVTRAALMAFCRCVYIYTSNVQGVVFTVYLLLLDLPSQSSMFLVRTSTRT